MKTVVFTGLLIFTLIIIFNNVGQAKEYSATFKERTTSKEIRCWFSKNKDTSETLHCYEVQKDEKVNKDCDIFPPPEGCKR